MDPGGHPPGVPCASATSPDSAFVGSAQGAHAWSSGGTVDLDTEGPVGDPEMKFMNGVAGPGNAAMALPGQHLCLLLCLVAVGV